MSFDRERLASYIADSLNSRFKNVEIVDVKIEQDIDRDGDPILRVLLIFDGEITDADVKVVVGAARQLQPKLDEIDDDIYPVLSFVSRLEYEGCV